jgi:ubiquinone/menaquinone biosynthesis C-methylase UbiE
LIAPLFETMPSDHEAQRLAQVYNGYRQSASVQARWDIHNPGNYAILRERQATIRRLLGARGWLPLAGRAILEVGCGSGKELASMRGLGAQPADLLGVDLLPERIAEARQQYPELNFRAANAEALDFPNSAFDLVLIFTVFSSILDRTMATNVAGEIRRVLQPGGGVLWYDFRFDNPRNPHVRGMTRATIAALFPGFDLNLQTVTLLPPLARRLGRATTALYPLLAYIPLLRTHYLGLFVKHP